jgi:hypothetical protein
LLSLSHVCCLGRRWLLLGEPSYLPSSRCCCPCHYHC